ncbi:mRNA export factor [Camelus dromedarius]|uniref:Rae1 protein homolog n=3 Tax=Camelus TaxID=9836 RepID=A0A5N4CVJ4_CAMDR|nr:mRNA export factor [Camelus dromedarius]
MAFAPSGPEASFFEVLDQHRASLLATLRRGGGEPAHEGTRLASRYKGFSGAHTPGSWKARTFLGQAGLEAVPVSSNIQGIRSIEIMCIYKYGSMAMSFEAHNLTVPAIRWLGLLPSDIKRLDSWQNKDILHDNSLAKMSLFGTTSGFGTGGSSMFGSTTTDNHNPMKDIEVTSSPDDSIGCLSFSPPTLPGNFLIAGSWANDVRCWEVQDSGQTIPKAQQMHTGPVLDVCWSDDGSKVFTASCDKTAKMWDLNSNQAIQIAQHDAPVKTIHWIKAPNYSCVMTGSWDKTLKFWDTRSSNPMMVLQLPERCYCADVIYPMAVVATAERGLIVYQLENQPSEFRRIESPLKHQHRCVAIFKDKQNKPTGFALGSIEGRVAIHYINPPNPAKDNFTFKCHRSNGTNTSAPQDIYAVNGIAFHPVHGTLATVGSDGRFSFWDKDARTKLKTSEQLDQPISACCFNHNGNIFAYASSYDWSKGHEFYNPQKKNYIFLRNAAEELKPRNKK